MVLAATLAKAFWLSEAETFSAQDSTGLRPKAQSTIHEQQPPFDKLELFGFFAAGPVPEYASRVVQQRGTNFTPDVQFVASFPFPKQQEILRGVRPRTAKTVSSDRDAAYELLRRAFEAKQSRQFAAANERFQQALQLAPGSSTLHLAYAANLLLSQNYAASETQARQALTLWPEDAEGHAILAACLTAQKKFPEGESESREALRIFPEHNLATFTLSVSLIHELKYKEAIPFLRGAITLLPSMPALKKFLGISLMETGETSEGIELLSWYAKAAPEDAEGHYYLGVAFRLKGKPAEAHAQFAEAVRLQPSNSQYEAAARPDTPQAAPEAAQGPKPEDGNISQNIYTNRFFGFTYEFPKGWKVLSADAARATMEIGGALISTGDPTEADLKKVVARKGHPLLFVMEPQMAGQPISTKTVIVNALDLGSESALSPETYMGAIGQRLKQAGMPIELTGAPEETKLGGRSFWKGSFRVQTAAGSSYMNQFVASEKGYFLIFMVVSQDPTRLPEIQKSLQSIHFAENSN